MKSSFVVECFSLVWRRQFEAEKVSARRNAEAQAKRIVARLTCERRLRVAQAAVSNAEVASLKLGRGIATVAELARSIVARLEREDRPVSLAAAEAVAKAIEGETDEGGRVVELPVLDSAASRRRAQISHPNAGSPTE